MTENKFGDETGRDELLRDLRWAIAKSRKHQIKHGQVNSYLCGGHGQNHKISLPQHDFHDFPGTGLHSLNPRVKFEGEGGRGENPPS